MESKSRRSQGPVGYPPSSSNQQPARISENHALTHSSLSSFQLTTPGGRRKSSHAKKRQNYNRATSFSHRRPRSRSLAEHDPDKSNGVVASDSSNTPYCHCRQPQDKRFMIACEGCDVWFHGDCVSISDEQAMLIEKYICAACRPIHGPLVLFSQHRPRFWRSDEPEFVFDAGGQPAQPPVCGSRDFVDRLGRAECRDAVTKIPMAVIGGADLTEEYFEKKRFDSPVLITRKNGLGLTVLPGCTTAADIETYVGSMREVQVIDVTMQIERTMLMREWAEYFDWPDQRERKTRLNLISLEFSGTPMTKLVRPPAFVRNFSWVDKYWPEKTRRRTGASDDDGGIEFNCSRVEFRRPEVQKYCLMSVADSFTDFHVDFGGTSVWYHLVRGEKVFYLVRPTQENLGRFEDWQKGGKQGSTFFGDNVSKDDCYRFTLCEGETVLMPGGWIHAVHTPVDSIAFGGNFLHSFDVDTPLRVHAMERRLNDLKKFSFPNFEPMHWYAAVGILREHWPGGAEGVFASGKGSARGGDISARKVGGVGGEMVRPPSGEYLVRAVRTLYATLSEWSKAMTEETDLKNNSEDRVEEDCSEARETGKILNGFLENVPDAIRGMSATNKGIQEETDSDGENDDEGDDARRGQRSPKHVVPNGIEAKRLLDALRRLLLVWEDKDDQDRDGVMSLNAGSDANGNVLKNGWWFGESRHSQSDEPIEEYDEQRGMGDFGLGGGGGVEGILSGGRNETVKGVRVRIDGLFYVAVGGEFYRLKQDLSQDGRTIRPD